MLAIKFNHMPEVLIVTISLGLHVFTVSVLKFKHVSRVLSSSKRLESVLSLSMCLECQSPLMQN